MRFIAILIAIVVFLVGLLYVLTTDAPDTNTLWAFLFGGLAAFAFAHVIWPPPNVP